MPLSRRSRSPFIAAIHSKSRHALLANRPTLFTENRARLKALMEPSTLAVVNANDILPTNADGTIRLILNADLFHRTGVDQEEDDPRDLPRRGG